MDHLQKLNRSCHTCDFGLSADQAFHKGWLKRIPKGHVHYCCRDRKSLNDPVLNCQRWIASYDGYDAKAATELPEEPDMY